MVAIAAMKCEHSPNGGIQWLPQVKPGMCSTKRCAPYRTAVSAWQSKLPAFDMYLFVVINFIVTHNHSHSERPCYGSYNMKSSYNIDH